MKSTIPSLYYSLFLIHEVSFLVSQSLRETKKRGEEGRAQ